MGDPFFLRLSKVVAERGPICVGIDPSADVVAHWGLADDAAGVETVARTTIAAVSDVAGIVKAQVAFFERHGSAGFAALERVLADARAAGLLVIADAKRGDIDSTNVGYAQAWLDDDSPLASDAVTLSCYLGTGAMTPLFDQAHRSGRGVFAVVASSNPEGRELQTASVAGVGPVESALLARLVEANRALDAGREPSRCVGAVIGATRRPEGLAAFEGPVLVAGLGAQGAEGDDVRSLRSLLCHDALAVNVSRSVLLAGPHSTAIAAQATRFADLVR